MIGKIDRSFERFQVELEHKAALRMPGRNTRRNALEDAERRLVGQFANLHG
ncbi:hypothetical protein D3C83_98660 [compost metagenome]